MITKEDRPQLPDNWHWCDRFIDARHYASNGRLEVTVYKSGDVEIYSRRDPRQTDIIPASVVVALMKANGVSL